MNKDIIFIIFKLLDIQSLINCSLISKLFNQIYNNEYFWEIKFKYDFNEKINYYINLFKTNESKKIYFKYYEIKKLIIKFNFSYSIEELFTHDSLNINNN